MIGFLERSIISHESVQPGSAARGAERKKLCKYSHLLRTNQFTSIVLEILGSPGSLTANLLLKVSEMLTTSSRRRQA